VLRHQSTDNGVPGFVIGGVGLLLLGHHHGTALGAHHDLVAGLFKLLHGHQAAIGARRKKRCLIDQVGEVGTGKSWRTAGQHTQADALIHGHLAYMHLENLLATADIRQPHIHLAVETTGAQQGLVEHVGAIGGGDHNYAFVAFKTVHFHQQLVEGLLALVVTAAIAAAAMATYGINLIDKDNAGGRLLGLLEHVAHPGSADTDKHFHKIGTGDGEKRHLCLTGNSLGEQGFTGTRRADHQQIVPARCRDLQRAFGSLLSFHLLEVSDRHGPLYLAARRLRQGLRALQVIEQADQIGGGQHGYAACPTRFGTLRGRADQPCFALAGVQGGQQYAR